jgi:hypothetical protein
MQYFGEDFTCYIQKSDVAIILTIKFLYTGHSTPSVQLSGSVSPIQTCWIISLSAFTWSTGFYQLSRYRVRTGCFVDFQVFYGFKNFVTAWQIGNNIIFSRRLLVCMWLLFRAPVKILFKILLTALGLY